MDWDQPVCFQCYVYSTTASCGVILGSWWIPRMIPLMNWFKLSLIWYWKHVAPVSAKLTSGFTFKYVTPGHFMFVNDSTIPPFTFGAKKFNL